MTLGVVLWVSWAQAAALIQALYSTKTIRATGPFLVVVPLSTMQNWCEYGNMRVRSDASAHVCGVACLATQAMVPACERPYIHTSVLLLESLVCIENILVVEVHACARLTPPPTRVCRCRARELKSWTRLDSVVFHGSKADRDNILRVSARDVLKDFDMHAAGVRTLVTRSRLGMYQLLLLAWAVRPGSSWLPTPFVGVMRQQRFLLVWLPSTV
jgi:hypothetical protein